MPSIHYFSALRSLLLFLPNLSLRVESTRVGSYLQAVRQYDNAAGSVENFDPTQANPARNVTCIGDDLALELPMIGDFNPNQVSVHKLCAKPQYNGGARGQHAGAYCSDPPLSPYTGNIAFDSSPGAEASPMLQNDRVLLSCRYRCYCNWGLIDPSRQPRANTMRYRLEVIPRVSNRTYELAIDRNDDFTTPRAQKMGKQGLTYVDSLELSTRSQLIAQDRRPRHRRPHTTERHISLDPGNKIQCDNATPTFNLPPPYQRWEFVHPDTNYAQQLCAVQLSGGYQ